MGKLCAPDFFLSITCITPKIVSIFYFAFGRQIKLINDKSYNIQTWKKKTIGKNDTVEHWSCWAISVLIWAPDNLYTQANQLTCQL